MSNKSKRSKELTKKQTLVMDLLKNNKVPLSAYDILDKLHDFGFRAPLQVYRALNKLIELGLVHRLETLNAFVACQHKNCESNYKKTTMFTICEMCGNVHEFVNTGLIKLVKFLETDGKFKTRRSVVEFKGVCSACTE